MTVPGRASARASSTTSLRLVQGPEIGQPFFSKTGRNFSVALPFRKKVRRGACFMFWNGLQSRALSVPPQIRSKSSSGKDSALRTVASGMVAAESL